MFEVYKVAAPKSKAFAPCDVLFTSDDASDNQLYVQRTDGKHRVIEFEAFEVDDSSDYFSLDEFRCLRDENIEREISIGDLAIYCFADSENQNVAFVFNDLSEYDENQLKEDIIPIFSERNSGSILDFLQRIQKLETFPSIANCVDLSNYDPLFLKNVMHSFLCAIHPNEIKVGIDFYKNGKAYIEGKILKIVFNSTIENEEFDQFRNDLSEFQMLSISKQTVNASPEVKQEVQGDVFSPKGGSNKREKKETGQLVLKHVGFKKKFTGGDIFALRERYGYSRKALADYLGVSVARIRRWENKKVDEPIGYNSPKLLSIVQKPRKPRGVSIGGNFWDLVVGKNRRRRSKEVLRFFEANVDVWFAFEVVTSNLELTYNVLNPYSKSFHNQQFIDAVSSIKVLPKDDDIGRPDCLVLDHHLFTNIKYVAAISTEGDAVRVIGVSGDSSSNKGEWIKYFSKLFLQDISKSQELLFSLEALRAFVDRETFGSLKLVTDLDGISYT